MEITNNPSTKLGFATREVPVEEMAGVSPMTHAPRVGDLALAEVIKLGRHKRVEVRAGYNMDIFPGDRVVGVFGNRYATDHFEGYVPGRAVEECDMLSVGGVFGEVVSRHSSMSDPTRLRVVGLVSDRDGRPINQRDHGLPALDGSVGGAEVILVVGSAMNSGKTTTVGTVARALNGAGYKVAAAKVTGTAAGKDARFFEACGASPVLDFISAGHPSTYMLGREEVLRTYHTILGHLNAADPDYIVLEVADGVCQRETRMILDSEDAMNKVDHVLFAAGDSLAVESGARFLRERGLPLRATAGTVTRSCLATREAEELTGLPCLNIERMTDGTLAEILDVGRSVRLERREHVAVAGAMGRGA
ncbi:MAG: DUF1611 domain-containing protein [Rubrobacteraceae bacterium]